MTERNPGEDVSRIGDERLEALVGPAAPVSYTVGVEPPPAPAIAHLPLDSSVIGWEDFEAFSLDLLDRLPVVRAAHRYGKRGAKQKGIDIAVEYVDGTRGGAQCKKVEHFRKGDALAAVGEIGYEADRYVILVSCVASPEARDVIDALPNWELWDLSRISTLVRQLPRESGRRLVEDHFSVEWRRRFLGASGPSLYQTPADAFADFDDATALFNHGWALVGRDDVLADLLTAVRDVDVRAVVIVGRGGIGKSKLLRELTLGPMRPDITFRYVSENIEATAASAEELPLEPIVLVIDDAHKRPDIEVLLGMARQRGRELKLIFATRPHHVDELRSQLARAGVDPREVKMLPLRELQPADRERLAYEALGPDLGQRFAHHLVAWSGDSPLVTVVGGRLLAAGGIDVRDATSADEFRVLVLDRFREERVGRVPDYVDKNLARSVLDLIAAVGPVAPEAERFREQAARFLGVDTPTLVRTIDELEGIEILLRRGRRVRITPDVLADHILEAATLTRQSHPTGYVERVFAAFRDVAPHQLLRNLAELDWRASIDRSETKLLDAIWQEIANDFSQASNERRLELLDLLAPVAYYQPRRLLALVEVAIRKPSSVDETRHPFTLYPATHDQVLLHLPGLLRGIAYTDECLPRAVELLWQLGRDDSRPTHQFPDHPMRVLAELAQYDLDKTLSMNEDILRQIERLLGTADAHSFLHSPLDVLDPLLAREAVTMYSRGHEVAMRAFGVGFEQTQPLRRRALDLVEPLVLGGDLKIARRAVESLTKALHEPHGYFGKDVPEGERAQWLPEQLDLLTRLERVLQGDADPLLKLEVVASLSWHAERSSYPEVKTRAKELIGLVEADHAYTMTGVLTRPWDLDWLPGHGRGRLGWGSRERELPELLAPVTQHLTTSTDAASVASALSARIEELERTQTRVQPMTLLFEIGRRDPEYAGEIAEYLIAHSDLRLAAWLGVLIDAVRRQNPPLGWRLARLALELEQVELEIAVAQSLRGVEWGSPPGAEQLAVLRKLIAHDDLRVKAQAIYALFNLASADATVARAVLLDVDVGEDAGLADELLGLLHDDYGIPFETLSDDDVRALLVKVERLRTIDDYHVSEFLAFASTRLPDEVVDLLLRRIERRDSAHSDYRPLPFEAFDHSLDGLAERPGYRDRLRGVRDRAGAPCEGAFSFWLPRLFAIVSRGFDDDALTVLTEWVETGEPDKLRGVALLVREAPSGFVFSRDEFVGRLLEQAQEAGQGVLQAVSEGLFASAIGGIRMGSPGKPMPADVELRNNAGAHTAKHISSPVVRDFYRSLARHAERRIADQLKDDEEFLNQ